MAFQRPVEGDLTVELDEDDGVVTIRIHGELTLLTQAGLVEKQREALARDPGGIVVDVSGMSFMDSSGLGAIIGLQREARTAGLVVAFAGFTELPRRVLEITHMDLVMDLHDTPGEAHAAVSSAVGDNR